MKYVNKNIFSTLFTRIEHDLHLPISPVTVLGYHAVSNNKTIVDISPHMFQRHLSFLKKNFQFITLDNVINYINGKQTFAKPAVALTFDDGYSDVFTTIAPILAKDNIPAATFILSNPDYANRYELENNKKLMSIKEIKQLQNLGWTIGCHSATHAKLVDKYIELEKEITLSKKQLEKELTTQISYFAYPKGIYNQNVITKVKKAGFSAAFAFRTDFITRKSNLFTIPRSPVDWTHTMEQFEAFFTNWGKYYLSTKYKLQRKFYEK